MKVTKTQLRRIIREEKAKMLKEQANPLPPHQVATLIEEAMKWKPAMISLFDSARDDKEWKQIFCS